MKFGIAIAARIPMMTTTIISSISVKPFSLRIIGFHSPRCRVYGASMSAAYIELASGVPN